MLAALDAWRVKGGEPSRRGSRRQDRRSRARRSWTPSWPKLATPCCARARPAHRPIPPARPAVRPAPTARGGWYALRGEGPAHAARATRQPASSRIATAAAATSPRAGRGGRRSTRPATSSQATQGADPVAGWRPDATKERIRFAPGILQDTMRWTNRPTFQQVLSFGSHRYRGPAGRGARLGRDAEKRYLFTPGPDARAAARCSPRRPSRSSTTAAPTSASSTSARSRRLKEVFRTENEVLLFAASGTGTMESARREPLLAGRARLRRHRRRVRRPLGVDRRRVRLRGRPARLRVGRDRRRRTTSRRGWPSASRGSSC